jgi:hypothetical protein
MENYNYRVMVANKNNEAIVISLFDIHEEALFCFVEFQKKYSNYTKIVIEATLKINECEK